MSAESRARQAIREVTRDTIANGGIVSQQSLAILAEEQGLPTEKANIQAERFTSEIGSSRRFTLVTDIARSQVDTIVAEAVIVHPDSTTERDIVIFDPSKLDAAQAAALYERERTQLLTRRQVKVVEPPPSPDPVVPQKDSKEALLQAFDLLFPDEEFQHTNETKQFGKVIPLLDLLNQEELTVAGAVLMEVANADLYNYFGGGVIDTASELGSYIAYVQGFLQDIVEYPEEYHVVAESSRGNRPYIRLTRGNKFLSPGQQIPGLGILLTDRPSDTGEHKFFSFTQTLEGIRQGGGGWLQSPNGNGFQLARPKNNPNIIKLQDQKDHQGVNSSVDFSVANFIRASQLFITLCDRAWDRS